MFIGHFALGLAAKPQAPRVSLAMLFAAAQLADLTWPILLAIGVEQVRIDPGNTAVTPLDFVSYPYSHSLLALVVWGLLLAWGYRLLAGNGRRAFLIIFSLVVSHWVLDYLTHRPDMPLYPGSAKFGLGLWHWRLNRPTPMWRTLGIRSDQGDPPSSQAVYVCPICSANGCRGRPSHADRSPSPPGRRVRHAPAARPRWRRADRPG